MISRRDTLALLCGAPLAAAVTNWSHDRHSAHFELTDGNGEIQWISASSFRVVRRWPDSARHSRGPEHSVNFTATDVGDHVLLTTKYLSVRVSKASFRLKVETVAGDEVLLEELTPAIKSTEGTRLHFASRADEDYFGLGPRGDANLSARGARVKSEWPLLISSAGFGMFHVGASRFDFDFSEEHRVLGRQADRVDYCFYYGPSPKEILEEHKQVRPMRASGLYNYGVRKPGQLPREATMLPGTTVLDLVRASNHAAMSGLHVPAIDLARLGDSPRVLQLAAVMPVVLGAGAPAGLAQMRAKLAPYFVTYVQEADDRGLPMLHPLPLQFPADREAIKHNDSFLLGDELLIAPLTEHATRRQVYLPMGVWTELATNVEHRGRRLVEVEAAGDAPPMLARNGSIVPLARADGTMELHYFPNLGAEFLLFEHESAQLSQFHAGPAVDYLRLEIESKVTRKYEWVIHHRGPAHKVEGPGEARYDTGRNNLHVTVDGQADTDRIVNILF